MLPEASIAVRLRHDGRAVSQVQIHSTRLTQATRLLTGRGARPALTMLPALFSLCGTAQGVAAVSAMEAAAGLAVSEPHRLARHALLLAETVAEHALAILRDWPALMGEAPDLAPLKGVKSTQTTLRTALYPDGSWLAVGGGRLAPSPICGEMITDGMGGLRAAIFAADPARILSSEAEFRAWTHAASTPAARLLRRIGQAGLDGLGQDAAPLMPAEGPFAVAERLANDSGTYVATPDDRGIVYETGPLARQKAHPLIQSLGGGLAGRLAARLIEVESAYQELVGLLPLLPPATGTPATANGAGLGRADAARGLLIHRVEMQEDTIARYQILAPTEWNFHPKGPLAAALLGRPAGTRLEEDARLMIAALDPCVACTVSVERA